MLSTRKQEGGNELHGATWTIVVLPRPHIQFIHLDKNYHYIQVQSIRIRSLPVVVAIFRSDPCGWFHAKIWVKTRQFNIFITAIADIFDKNIKVRHQKVHA